MYRFSGFLEMMSQSEKDIYAFDETLFPRNNTQWIFVNVKEIAGASIWDELCLFYAIQPLATKCSPQPMNPIVSDVRYARSFGRLFVESGELYRPSQNCFHRYRYGLNVNRILKLTPMNYQVQPIRSYGPNWDPSIRGLRTFNQADGLTLIDAIRRNKRRKFR